MGTFVYMCTCGERSAAMRKRMMTMMYRSVGSAQIRTTCLTAVHAYVLMCVYECKPRLYIEKSRLRVVLESFDKSSSSQQASVSAT